MKIIYSTVLSRVTLEGKHGMDQQRQLGVQCAAESFQSVAHGKLWNYGCLAHNEGASCRSVHRTHTYIFNYKAIEVAN